MQKLRKSDASKINYLESDFLENAKYTPGLLIHNYWWEKCFFQKIKFRAIQTNKLSLQTKFLSDFDENWYGTSLWYAVNINTGAGPPKPKLDSLFYCQRTMGQKN